MKKIIDYSKSVYEICNEYPEVINILAQIGFSDIAKPGMLKTAGRFMTIPKGAAMKKFDLNSITLIFQENGYEIK